MTHLAAVGDSITAECYTAARSTRLGVSWETRNYGVGGSTITKLSDKTYWRTGIYPQAVAWVKDGGAVVIQLGTNDAVGAGFAYIEDVADDCVSMVHHFQKTARVLVVLPPPCAFRPELDATVIPGLLRCAATTGAVLVDVRGVFEGRLDLLRDGVHPGPAGCDLLVDTVSAALNAPRVDAGFDASDASDASGGAVDGSARVDAESTASCPELQGNGCGYSAVHDTGVGFVVVFCLLFARKCSARRGSHGRQETRR